MKSATHRCVPWLIGATVLLLIAAAQALSRTRGGAGVFQRLEWITYDWRMRAAAQASPPIATNLGFVAISDASIKALLDGTFDFRAGLYWPRHVYGRLIHELSAQGATGIGLDILLAELRPDHPPAVLPDGLEESSDHFFARELASAGNVILGAEKGALPHELFRTNAWAIGAIDAQRDADGIFRRARACDDFLIWHPLIRQAGRLFDLSRGRVEPGRLALPTVDGRWKYVPLDALGQFDQALFYEKVTGKRPTLPPNAKTTQPAFTQLRVWDMGLALAARQLGLDLSRAQIERDRIVLRGAAGRERVIPVDAERRFCIDWSVRPGDRRLTTETIESLLLQEQARRKGGTNTEPSRWHGKIAFVGSTASGSDLTDLGATPLEKETLMTSRFWNVANSMLLNRFVQPAPASVEWLALLGLVLAGGWISWQARTWLGAGCVLALAGAYALFAQRLFVETRYWLPMVVPLAGLLLTHFLLVSYRAVFEQAERRRIRSVFGKVVSPNVVQELLGAKNLSLGGARREITVLFADVRGFTEMTERHHARAEEFVREQQLTGVAAEAYLEQQAQEVLRTVNLYLSALAEVVKRHDGTLDKYIGDCVMAFWGAPTSNPAHAVAAVRAAIDAQRVVADLNTRRAAENQRREQENAQRAAAGQPSLPMLTLLAVGTGVNSGKATVGLMGSPEHIVNYTVFGREVNLASRLEGVSGRGRILVGETTHGELTRHAPELAATCKALAPVMVKGLRDPVKIFEVPWKDVAVSDSVPAGESEVVETPARMSVPLSRGDLTAVPPAPAENFPSRDL